MSSFINNIGKPWFAVGGAWQAFRMLTASQPPVPEVNGPWRPPQWSQPQLYMISLSEIDPSTGDPVVTNYFFDAVLRARHRTELRRTEQPIQNGANTADHAYMMPARLSLEIGMSDAMDRYVATLYTGNSSKSISAYQTLKQLQQLKQPLTVTTRLYTYQNMLIEGFEADDTNRTRFGLRAIINFVQLLTGYITTEKISSRPQATDQTPQGTVTPDTDVSNFVDYQFTNNGPDLPGSGGFSSFGSKYQVQTGISSGGSF